MDNEAMDLADLMRTERMNMREIAKRAGVSYTTVRTLGTGVNTGHMTLAKIRNAIFERAEREDGETCDTCAHNDEISDEFGPMCMMRLFYMPGDGRSEIKLGDTPCGGYRKVSK